MTVFTKIKGASDAKKCLRPKNVAYTVDSAVYQREENCTLSLLRKYHNFISLCMILLLLWLLIASFLAGTFFYRQLRRKPTYYGWCGTSFVQRGHNERLEESLEINPDEVCSSVIYSTIVHFRFLR